MRANLAELAVAVVGAAEGAGGTDHLAAAAELLAPPCRLGAALSAVLLNHRIFCFDDAPVLLLGGSLGTNLSMWQPQVAALSGRFRLIAFDQRGHGTSLVPPTPYTVAELGADVVALMDALGVQRASYAGISIGGMAGIWLGARTRPIGSTGSRRCAPPPTLRPHRAGWSGPGSCVRRERPR